MATKKPALTVFTPEMKALRDCALERVRALEGALKHLAKAGVNGVPKVLSTYGDHLTPTERALLENATAKDIENLVRMGELLKELNAPPQCI